MSSYDPRCEELAREFLPSNINPQLYAELAVVIQQAVEDWLESKKAELLEDRLESKRAEKIQ